MRRNIIAATVAATAVLLLAPDPVLAVSKGFPGATGYGAGVADGGAGGIVINVTNLNDSGGGSLRACVEGSSVARTCNFRVGGTINLATRLNIQDDGNITIPCQTAPGDGIQIMGTGAFTVLNIQDSSDIIITHCRFRSPEGANGGAGPDIVDIDASTDIILRHNTFQGGSDEVIGCTGDTGEFVNDITLQQNIFSHGWPDHSKATLFCNRAGAAVRGFSVYANLFAHSNDRMPEAELSDLAHFDFVNNVVYNWASEAMEIKDDDGGSDGEIRVDVEANVFRKGPDTSAGGCAIIYFDGDNTADPTDEGTIWASNNLLQNWGGTTCLYDTAANARSVGSRHKTITVSPLRTNTEVLSRITTYAGAWPRDSFDTTLMTEVNNLTGSIPAEGGTLAWPTLAGGTACTDADADGMCATWESANGFSDSNAADRNTVITTAGACFDYHALTCFLRQKHEDVVP
jgi:pectate lyase